jgi:hypothetical protein
MLITLAQSLSHILSLISTSSCQARLITQAQHYHVDRAPQPQLLLALPCYYNLPQHADTHAIFLPVIPILQE